MAKALARLSALKVQRLSRKGMHADGGGLYLQIAASGAKSWIYRFMLHGKLRDMGLGASAVVTLAEARKRADDARRLRSQGIDPIEARKQARTEAMLKAAHSMTFKRFGFKSQSI